ncbi:MAG TPA: carbamate kinase, partial [Anaerolineaceae bacterium]|nr:carbamate kinase [Anaerolineaceae bacterium]
MSKKIAVVAIGGNSLIKDKNHQTVEDQYQAAKETTYHIADMIEAGWDVAIGHGNGPQVGFILRRSEIAAKVEGMHEVPLDVCGADSQGAIGYSLQQTLQNELHRRGIKKAVATVVTQVAVDRNDKAFTNPSKPIGGFMDEAEAKHREKDLGWNIVEDAGRGWRRVVASPIPVKVVELDAVEALIEAGVIVVTVGGGGIPVVENEDGSYEGVAAVIDKDFASSLLARLVKADLFLISTAVEKVAINFGNCILRDTVNITGFPPLQQEVTDTSICAGEIFYLPWGAEAVSAGSYSDTLRYGGGCDSLIRRYNISVYP